MVVQAMDNPRFLVLVIEHRRLRRLIGSLTDGHEALTLYIQHIEDIVTNSLDEWASTKQPFEFYTERKRATYKIMTHFHGLC